MIIQIYAAQYFYFLPAATRLSAQQYLLRLQIPLHHKLYRYFRKAGDLLTEWRQGRRGGQIITLTVYKYRVGPDIDFCRISDCPVSGHSAELFGRTIDYFELKFIQNLSF